MACTTRSMAAFLMCLFAISGCVWAAKSPANAKYGGGFKSGTIFADNLSSPREIKVLPNGDFVVVEKGKGQVTRMWDSNGDGYSSSSERKVVAKVSGDTLNHGLLIRGGFLYASSQNTVYRWKLSDSRSADFGSPTKVITGIPSGVHSTRTLLFDSEGRFYVTLGSNGNIDTSGRAGIRRFRLDGSLPKPWSTSEFWARGLRNTVGLATDSRGEIWGIDQGYDMIGFVRDEIDTEDNPAEELNRLYKDRSGVNYGYPRCFTIGKNSGFGVGQQLGLNRVDDGWCRSSSNNVAPALAMQAHSSPINIVFKGSDAFVSFKGSWNRDISTGYRVIKVRFENNWPRRYEPVFYWSKSTNSSSTVHSGKGWGRRPTGLTISKNGNLVIADEQAGDVVILK